MNSYFPSPVIKINLLLVYNGSMMKLHVKKNVKYKITVGNLQIVAEKCKARYIFLDAKYLNIIIILWSL